MVGLVTIEDVRGARERGAGLVRTTPLWHSESLSQRFGVPILLKCEQLQRTGSFKPRGAVNMLALAENPAGVIAASAGNHAQGVALAASARGIPATVVMPREAPLAKRLATEGYGARVVLINGPLAAAIEEAKRLAAEQGLLFVPPYDHPHIVAGQGTLGLELLEQDPDIDMVIVPTGGGGLLAGVALAVKSLRPSVRVIGVQAQAMHAVVTSLREGHPVAAPAVRTIADGAAVARPSDLTFDLIREYVDDVVTVSEESIAQAIVTLIERTRFVVEGAGALGLAALIEGKVRPHGRTAIVLSGGNIDVNLLDRIVARGLRSEGRHRELTVAAANMPGELAKVTAIVAAAGANVLDVDHDLTVADLPVGVVRLTFRIEVAGDAAYDSLVASMRASGLQPGVATDLATAAAAAMPW